MKYGGGIWVAGGGAERRIKNTLSVTRSGPPRWKDPVCTTPGTLPRITDPARHATNPTPRLTADMSIHKTETDDPKGFINHDANDASKGTSTSLKLILRVRASRPWKSTCSIERSMPSHGRATAARFITVGATQSARLARSAQRSDSGLASPSPSRCRGRFLLPSSRHAQQTRYRACTISPRRGLCPTHSIDAVCTLNRSPRVR